MRDPKQLLEQLRETLAEFFCDDPYFDSYLDPISAALDERKILAVLLGEWLHNGRFLVANTPEADGLVERTRIALNPTPAPTGDPHA